MDLKSLIAEMDRISTKLVTEDDANPYANNPEQAAIYSRLSPVDQEWATRGGGRPDLTDRYIIARMPNQGKPVAVATAPVVPQEDLSALQAKLKELETLVNQYVTLKSTVSESQLYFADMLIESFGYDPLEEDATLGLGNAITNFLPKAASGAVTLTSKAVNKLLGPAIVVYQGWTQIDSLPKDMPQDKYREEITKIISKLIAEYGIFMVGGIIGGAIGGAITGPGSIVGFIAGGLYAQYSIGDDINQIIDGIISHIFGDNTPTAADTNSTTHLASSSDPEVAELQDLFGIDGTGILDSNTIKTIQSELVKLGAVTNTGQPLIVDGDLGADTIAAIQKFYTA